MSYYNSYYKDAKEVKHKDIKLMQEGAKNYYYAEYKDRCNRLNVDKDNLIRGFHDYVLKEDNIWYMINFICLFDKMIFVSCGTENLNAWFRRPIDDKPFEGKCPLELIQEDARSVLKIRFYANGLAEEEARKHRIPQPY